MANDIGIRYVSPAPTPPHIESTPLVAADQTGEIKFQSFSKSQLLKKTFSGVIANEKFFSTLVKIAKLTLFIFAALITGWRSTDVGKAMVIKCIRESLKIYENVSSVIFVRNAQLSSKILQRSFNLPSVGDVLKSQDLKAARHLASTLTTKIRELPPAELQQLGLSADAAKNFEIPPKNLESGIHKGICAGTTLALLSKVQNESATAPINAENLTAWVADQQGTVGGERPKGWVSDAAANQAVYSYLLDHIRVNSDLVCFGGTAKSQLQSKTIDYSKNAFTHMMENASAIIPKNLPEEIRPDYGKNFLVSKVKSYVQYKQDSKLNRGPEPTPERYVEGFKHLNLNDAEKAALTTALTNTDKLQKVMNDYDRNKGTWEECVKRYVEDPNLQQSFINDQSILNAYEKQFSTGNEAADDSILMTRKLASIIPREVPETSRPPFNCPIEFLTTHAEAFMRQKEGQSATTPDSYLRSLTGLSESEEKSLSIMLTSVAQLKEALMHKRENNELPLRDCIEKYVENKLMAELFAGFDAIIEGFTLGKMTAIGRGADYQQVEGFNLGMGLVSGSDHAYLQGMKDRLEPGSYELSFSFGSTAHSTALIITNTRDVFWHDSNIGLIQCDPDQPELTILAALQTYKDPQNTRAGEPGEMFHAIEIVKYTAHQPPIIAV